MHYTDDPMLSVAILLWAECCSTLGACIAISSRDADDKHLSPVRPGQRSQVTLLDR